MKPRYHIGIDPDITDTGLAIWDCETKQIRYNTVNLVTFNFEQYNRANTLIHIEASWLVQLTNWHNKGINTNTANKISKNIGQNQGYGMAIRDLLKHKGFQVQEIKPMVKHGWKQNGTWTPTGREMFEKLTGIKKGTITDDQRDAVLLVYGK